MNKKEIGGDRTGLEIAVIGMAGRFPGAKNIHEFWNNIKNGIESITFFSEKELEEAGVNKNLLKNPSYVKAYGCLEDREIFDASFFGYTPQEAELMNPQTRLFHECVWEALENAGYNPDTCEKKIGIYAGTSPSFSWEVMSHLTGKREILGGFVSSHLVGRDYLCTRVSYNLNLKGASSFMHTACSTSLVAVHQACRALLMGESDIIIAGGVSLTSAPIVGYMYKEGMIFSPDGHCRTFDAKSCGTIGGEGVGVVVLKRLKTALEDRDHIYAIIKGTATNNDGKRKVGYTAPSIEAQAEAIRTAQKMARINAESIAYIETHGTGTALGDPVEIEALKLAFASEKRNYCAIGSVKSNLGHLDETAGITGFIKTVLIVYYKHIPPSLHFETPNPKIDFSNSPFYVCTTSKKWASSKYSMRAGVSSFGIGGTNAHVVLEEAPQEARNQNTGYKHEKNLFLLSAKNQWSLEQATRNFKVYLLNNPHLNFADVAYTLQVGRKAFRYRQMLICSDVPELIEALETPGSPKAKTFHLPDEKEKRVIFMFPGQGSQYVNMGRELYEKEPVFRNEMDLCFDILKPLTENNIKELLYPHTPSYSEINNPLDINNTEIAQPLLFAFEYALAKLLIAWGINPYGMIGHSIGEYVPACLAGVFSLEDALKLVVTRGKLMQRMPKGAMLGIPLSEETLVPILKEYENISLAAVNSVSHCVVSGSFESINAIEKQLKMDHYETTRLHTSHAFHSKMMEPILKEFKETLSMVTMHNPRLQYISNLTGRWITTEEATYPNYWAMHLRKTVRFADGVTEILKKGPCIFIEIGAGKTLSTLVRQNENKENLCVNLVKHPKENISDNQYLLAAIGQLWLYGKSIDWKQFYSQDKRYRVPLPTYPFNGTRYWIEGNPFEIVAQRFRNSANISRKPDLADWFFTPLWQQSIPIEPVGTESLNWLIFMGDNNFDAKLVQHLVENEQHVIKVKIGQHFAPIIGNDDFYTINPELSEDYDALFVELLKSKQVPQHIIHMWGVTGQDTGRPGLEKFDRFQDTGLFSLLNIVQATGRLNITEQINIEILTDNMQKITGEEILVPEKATIVGAAKIIPLEYPNITCRCFDISIPLPESQQEGKLLNLLQGEFTSDAKEKFVAYRGTQRWIEIFKPYRLEKKATAVQRFKQKGVYLIIGGFGGMGFSIAEHLANHFCARLILVGRSLFPPKDLWEQWLKTHKELESTAIKIKKIQEWETMGAEIMIANVDVSNLEQITQLFARVNQHFQQINGIIHAAGVIDFGGIIQKRTREITDQYMASKVKGVLILEQLFKNQSLDFLALFSSIGNSLYSGKFGQVSYNAANEFLSAYAAYRSAKDDLFTVTIDWDDWKEVGMSVRALKKQYGDKDDSSQLELRLEDALTPSEGVEVFCRIMENQWHRITVSTSDLNARLQSQEKNLHHTSENVSTEKMLKDTSTSDKHLFQRPELTTSYMAPETEIETVLADIWQQLSGIQQIGIHDDFFELGGDSLKAMTLIANIERSLHVRLPLAEIFNSPTIQKIAHYIMQTKRNKFHSIKPTEEKEYYQLSPAQKRLYYLYCVEKESTAYNQPQIQVLTGKYNIEILEKAVCQLIQRHESLRASIEIINDNPVQKIFKTVAFNLKYYETNEIYLKDVLKKFVRPFDLSEAPLIRMEMIKVEEEKYILMWDIHHIVSDGTSNTLFIHELLLLCEGKELPPLKMRYKDYLDWQSTINTSNWLKKQEEYWLKKFSGEIPVLDLKNDFQRPKFQQFNGDLIQFVIGHDQTDRINALRLDHKVTLFMLLLSIYNVFLSKISNQEDIIVGTAIKGREHDELQNMMGMFVSTLALRNFPRKELTFIEFLDDVKKNTIDAFNNQDYPFEELVGRVAPIDRSSNRNPLFSVSIVLQTIDHEQDEASTSPLQQYKNHNSKFDLALVVLKSPHLLTLSIEYSTELFKKETIRWFTEYFREIVTMIVNNPHQKLSEIGKATEEEKMKKLSLFADDLYNE